MQLLILEDFSLQKKVIFITEKVLNIFLKHVFSQFLVKVDIRQYMKKYLQLYIPSFVTMFFMMEIKGQGWQ